MRRQLSVLVMFVGACQTAEVSPLGDAGVWKPWPDGGPVGSIRDGGPRDVEPPQVGPVRRLVRYSPLGTLPADNLVMNPTLDLLSSLSPGGLRGQPARYLWAVTPSQQPVLRIEARDVVVVPVQSRPRGLYATVWLGRSEDAPALFAQVFLLGLERGGGDAPVEVELVEASEGTRILDGVVWRKLSVRTATRFLGQFHLLVDNRNERSLFMTGPVVVADTLNVASSERRQAPWRPATAVGGDRRAMIAEFERRARQRAERSIGASPVPTGLRVRRSGLRPSVF